MDPHELGDVFGQVEPFDRGARARLLGAELEQKRVLSSEKIRKLLGRDLIGTDDAIRASAATLIQYGAV